MTPAPLNNISHTLLANLFFLQSEHTPTASLDLVCKCVCICMCMYVCVYMCVCVCVCVGVHVSVWMVLLDLPVPCNNYSCMKKHTFLFNVPRMMKLRHHLTCTLTSTHCGCTLLYKKYIYIYIYIYNKSKLLTTAEARGSGFPKLPLLRPEGVGFQNYHNKEMVFTTIVISLKLIGNQSAQS